MAAVPKGATPKKLQDFFKEKDVTKRFKLIVKYLGASVEMAASDRRRRRLGGRASVSSMWLGFSCPGELVAVRVGR
jgi:hypothetical protein